MKEVFGQTNAGVTALNERRRSSTESALRLNLSDTAEGRRVASALVCPDPPFVGPLILPNEPAYTDIVAAMAADLTRFDAFTDEADAVRSLMATGRYGAFHILRFIDDARQLAMQGVVAREMGES